MGDSDGTGKGIIAERLNRLFATVTPLGKPYTLREVADGINAQEGKKVMSVQYLAQLRNGDRRSPSVGILQAIASWFGVSVSYLIDSEALRRSDEERWFSELMRDPGVRRVAFRAEGLGQDSLKLVVGMLDLMRKADGLLPVVDGPNGEPVALPEPRRGPDASARQQAVSLFPWFLPPGAAGRGVGDGGRAAGSSG